MEEIIQENQEESAKTIQEELEKALDIEETAEKESESAVKIGDILTRDEFEQRFFELFDMAGDLTAIEELKINREKNFEVAGAKATAKRLYDCAQKYKLMHFLIENSGGWFADAVLIGGFCYAKANVVVYHYSGQPLGVRLIRKFRRMPAAVQQKAGIFAKFFKKEVTANESQTEN